MGEFQRGRVRRIILEFEYPDGSLKTLNVDSPSEVGMIAFDEHWMRDDDLSLFRVSEDDWRQNPSMLMYPRPGSPPGSPEARAFCSKLSRCGPTPVCSPLSGCVEPPSALDLIWPQ